MKKIIFAVALTLMTISMPVFARDARNESVSFATGSSSAIISETITGYQTVNYMLRARAGQSMVVDLKTNNGVNYFNIFEPGKGPGDDAMFIGSLQGNHYKGTLPMDGEYTVQVYLMRSGARRNEKANYTLEIRID